jgi:hypothetical protein
MKKFSDILPTLENADYILRIELLNEDGSSAGIIENKPGSQGSVKVYHHLWKKWGSITMQAAEQGLKLYAEHTEDAEHYPGKHPNIDRLFSVIQDNKPLSVRMIETN